MKTMYNYNGNYISLPDVLSMCTVNGDLNIKYRDGNVDIIELYSFDSQQNKEDIDKLVKAIEEYRSLSKRTNEWFMLDLGNGEIVKINCVNVVSLRLASVSDSEWCLSINYTDKSTYRLYADKDTLALVKEKIIKYVESKDHSPATVSTHSNTGLYPVIETKESTMEEHSHVGQAKQYDSDIEFLESVPTTGV